ncbi:Folate receptor beta-like protein [Dinothrombium tinctorium]|uniref:Folate receptor beta-like protein n=1 Tax=Dinothrombium tinctorium TaxID=1965070 RepID=A0A3S3P226_9ACAR|nr:Folate receptor beta-like protein [Dinothrombium tinctorium]
MSQKCAKFFERDACFLNCEPHIGFWLVNARRSFGVERMYKVPLCATACNEWWNACKNDFTCHRNWPKQFNAIDQGNHCRNSTCKRFSEIWTSAKDFCETVWNESWEYTDDQQPCMKLSFNPQLPNPNKGVAEYYIKKLDSMNDNFFQRFLYLFVEITSKAKRILFKS